MRRPLLIENEDALVQALHDYEDGLADFADCLTAARYQQLGCSTLLTFGAKASRLPVFQVVTAASGFQRHEVGR